jgi:hypothetical protein
MTHPQFRIDTLHERSRELAHKIDRTRLLADQHAGPALVRREVAPGSHGASSLSGRAGRSVPAA